MKKILIVLTSCFIMSALNSCKKSAKEIESEYIASQVKEFNIGNDKKWIIVLPGLGCKGCIQEGEAFLKEHASNENIQFILTRIESVKLLKQKIKIDVTKRPNIILDKANNFDIPSSNSIYPLIIEVNNKQVKNYEFQSPANSAAFSMLSENLKQK